MSAVMQKSAEFVCH